VEVVTSSDRRQYLQVIHESVRDFYLQPHVHERLGLDTSTDFSLISNRTIFEACRGFILCSEFSYCLPPSIKSVIKVRALDLEMGWTWLGHPFTQYALENVPVHAAAAGLMQEDHGSDTRGTWMRLYRRWLAIFGALSGDKPDNRFLRRFNGLLIEAGILTNELEAAQELYCAVHLHWLYLDLKSNSDRQVPDPRPRKLKI